MLENCCEILTGLNATDVTVTRRDLKLNLLTTTKWPKLIKLSSISAKSLYKNKKASRTNSTMKKNTKYSTNPNRHTQIKIITIVYP